MKGKILKKVLAAALLLALVTGGVPVQPFSRVLDEVAITANAAEVASGNCGKSTNEGGEESVKWSLDDDGTLTISGKGDMEDYIGVKPWVDYSAQIKTVVIEDGVTSIGNESFYHYQDALTSVTIPPSVKRIGDNAFYRCKNLTSFNIPNGVETIGDGAFNGCGPQSLTIPASVTSIGEYAFNYCNILKSISLKRATPPTLGENAFYYSKEYNINTEELGKNYF